MDKSKIPSINLKSVFYGHSVKKIVEWLEQLSLISDAEIYDMRHISWNEAVDVIARFYEAAETRTLVHARLINDFPEKSCIGPAKTEEILGCSTTERKRWEDEGRLPALDYFNVGSKRKPIWASMYCRRTIESLTDETVESWREEHSAALRESRISKIKEVFRSRNVIVQALRPNEKVYPIHGPVLVDSGKLDAFWEEYRDKVPWGWDEIKHIVVMLDFNTNEVLHIKVNKGQANRGDRSGPDHETSAGSAAV
ncbi:hypothetical protein DFR58_14718 [Anaerobacterium chartisolvens]|uniref:Uncharacterized protein n=1 Tax=Anaerobacterium chartisolvens TaxID=1297424 RepID=A0A369AHT2_9FIRM|nr:hypothetical protein [Anaerobacterium chartisolvens]RCX07898.1 hypothetical protein DFR58_14718 [Anaerobacterium chartisolvens]